MSQAERSFDPIETLPRKQLEALQEQRLLELLPFVYEHSGLVREAWQEARVHPREIRSLDDFRERVPFLDKDAIRRYRDRHGDPYGGVLCVDPRELTAVMSTSGTTGDPTLVAERWEGEVSGGLGLARDFWEIGVRPGDYLTCMLFTFRGPFFSQFVAIGATPVFFDHHPDEFRRYCETSLALRPTAQYTLSGPLVAALQQLEPRLGFDLKDVFSSYKGIVFAGEPLGRAARRKAEEWGIQFHLQTSLGDVGAATECREHDGCHAWEDTALVEHLEPDGAAPVQDGERGELVVTALTNRTMPLVRYRSDDLVRLTRRRCGCGRTHARIWPLGRKGDEVVVAGRRVLPIDVWEAVEVLPETSAGLFQIIRTQRECDALRLRVGFAGGSSEPPRGLAQRVVASVFERVGVEPVVELVPQEALLRLGPPHKIPRVAKN
jgi:phenylacetate-CoA ligase